MPDVLEELRPADGLFSLAYEELRRLASAVQQSDPHCTLNPTALVHEAWLKLAGTPKLATTSPIHFKRIAGRAMRQVLVEAARRRHSAKRGGGQAILVDSENLPDPTSSCEQEMLALESALDELEQVAPRQAQLVESLFLAGWSFRRSPCCWKYRRRPSTGIGARPRPG